MFFFPAGKHRFCLEKVRVKKQHDDVEEGNLEF